MFKDTGILQCSFLPYSNFISALVQSSSIRGRCYMFCFLSIQSNYLSCNDSCVVRSLARKLMSLFHFSFRRHVLSLNLNGCNSLMRKLQHLFAFLAHTQVCQFSICFSLSLDLYTKTQKPTWCHGNPLEYIKYKYYSFVWEWVCLQMLRWYGWT